MICLKALQVLTSNDCLDNILVCRYSTRKFLCFLYSHNTHNIDQTGLSYMVQSIVVWSTL